MSTYTAVVKQDGDWWIGWVEEVSGVNAQESTREGLVASLKVVLQVQARAQDIPAIQFLRLLFLYHLTQTN